MKRRIPISSAGPAKKQKISTSNDSSSPGVQLNCNKQQCPICLCTVQDAVILSKCLHCFCRSCVLQWGAISNNKCPSCKTTFDTFLTNVQDSKIFRIEPLNGHGHKMEALTKEEYDRRVKYKKNCRSYPFPYCLPEPPAPRELKERGDSFITPWLQREIRAITGVSNPVLLVTMILRLLKSESLNKIAEQLGPYFEEYTNMFMSELRVFLCHPTGCTKIIFDAHANRNNISFVDLTDSASSPEPQTVKNESIRPPELNVRPPQIDLTGDVSESESEKIVISLD